MNPKPRTPTAKPAPAAASKTSASRRALGSALARAKAASTATATDGTTTKSRSSSGTTSPTLLNTVATSSKKAGKRSSQSRVSSRSKANETSAALDSVFASLVEGQIAAAAARADGSSESSVVKKGLSREQMLARNAHDQAQFEQAQVQRQQDNTVLDAALDQLADLMS
ncbi:hypothetical protein BC828DRAFT_406985 [Blastocladiella britannica]|nr:hypothetical protein BC828DRAFT_406985 [Blastocladiella britannica]